MISLYWISGVLLGVIWFVPVVQGALSMKRIADVTEPQWQPPETAELPSLVIVVPARNEEAVLEPALRSLLGLDYPGYQVVAMNDRSEDRTGEIMERLKGESQGRLQMIHIRELPAGWLGKTHAMWLGAQQHAGDWILFTDADCVFHPETMRRALFYATQTGIDHLVLFPTAIMKTPGEKMMMSFFPVSSLFAYRLWKVSDPKARDAVGVGAFNLVRRSAYESAGTYERLRLEIVDDMKLGEVLKKEGFCQNIVLGKGLVSLRWGVGALGVVRNLEKNMFALLQFRLGLMLCLCFGFLFLGICPFLGLLLAPGWAKAGFAVAVTMCAVTYWGMSRITGASPLYFLTYPIASTLGLYTLLRSAFLVMRDGGVTWRGTKYSLAELRGRKGI
ncbi:MAG TPA: glycosyltransferase [Candidatus Saccharimonadales bacterium]|jgi:hypothetical protein|nr:glycosyltransferase [Candidatus Saccharimonadales bacterium]